MSLSTAYENALPNLFSIPDRDRCETDVPFADGVRKFPVSTLNIVENTEDRKKTCAQRFFFVDFTAVSIQPQG